MVELVRMLMAVKLDFMIGLQYDLIKVIEAVKVIKFDFYSLCYYNFNFIYFINCTLYMDLCYYSNYLIIIIY